MVNQSTRVLLRTLFCLSVLLSSTFFASEGRGQRYAPYSAFAAMSAQRLTPLQVKLTWVGSQDFPVPSIVITSSGMAVNLPPFRPFSRFPFPYSDDTLSVPWHIEATNLELKEIIDGIGTLDCVVVGGVRTPPVFSLAFFSSLGGNRCFEAILDDVETQQVFEKIRMALINNGNALVVLDRMGCIATASLTVARPSEVSQQVAVAINGFRRNLRNGTLVTEATLKNNGPSLSGPLILVVTYQKAGYSLLNATGYTCGVSPPGHPYLVVSSPGGNVGSGQSVRVTLEFRDPYRFPIECTFRVFSGPGSR